MRTFWVESVIVVMFVGLLTGCSGGHGGTPIPTGTVTGIVLIDNTSGQLMLGRALTRGATAVAGATISVRGNTSVSTTSNAQGAFVLSKVPCGQQTLYVSCPGYTRRGFPVTVLIGENTITSMTVGTPAPGKWTVLVYMCADNNLDTYAMDDINEMEKAALPADDSDQDVQVLVQLDRSNQNTGSNSWTDTRRYRIMHDTNAYAISSPRIDDPQLGELDMGNPTVLHDFITWGQSYAPAEHYLLVIWNHGSGWDPVNDAPTSTRAICIDDDSGTVIRDVDLSTALTVNDPIDIVATDACLMSMLEVAYQLRRQADYLVASEEETPADGYNYTTIVSKLINEHQTITPRDFAAYMAQSAYTSWTAYKYTQAQCAVIDLSKVTQVAQSLDILAQKLITVREEYAQALRTSWLESIPFGNPPVDICDLSDYATRLPLYTFDDSIASAAKAVTASVREAVVANYATTNMSKAHGISIYYPSTFTFNRYAKASYADLDLAKDTAWDEWLAISP